MSRALSRTCVSFAIVGSAIAFSPFVHAAGGNEAAAQALFDEAKKLADAGKYAEACPKFAESNKLDRGAGTLIHLGNCYEKNKQTASAWATYKEASSAAQALGRKDWEKLAGQRAAALEVKLAKLIIRVDKANEGATVSRDGTSVSSASWGVAIPVDTGEHVVEATQPGHKSFKTTARVSRDGESVEVAIPKLEVEAGAAATTPEKPVAPPVTTTTPPPPDADKGGSSSQKTIGLVFGGIGVAGIAVGAVTGLMAMGKSSDAKDACPSDGTCANREAVDASDSAKTFGLISTIGFIAGGALAAGGAVLYFTAPSKSAASSSSRVRVAPNGAGFTVMGVF